MANGSDHLCHISLASEDTHLILTVYFSGGPISGFVSLGSEQKPFSFAADPFFRRQDNYIASGSIYIPSVSVDERIRAISVVFTNASAIAAAHRIELSSPRKLNFAEAGPGVAAAARLFSKAGNVPRSESVQYVFVVQHP